MLAFTVLARTAVMSAVAGTLFFCGFKKKKEATEEEVAASNKLRSEREAAEAKELRATRRRASSAAVGGEEKSSRPAARPAGGRSGHQIFGAPVTPPAPDIPSVGRIFITF